jgi:hypothetical protein
MRFLCGIYAEFMLKNAFFNFAEFVAKNAFFNFAEFVAPRGSKLGHLMTYTSLTGLVVNQMSQSTQTLIARAQF